MNPQQTYQIGRYPKPSLYNFPILATGLNDKKSTFPVCKNMCVYSQLTRELYGSRKSALIKFSIFWPPMNSLPMCSIKNEKSDLTKHTTARRYKIRAWNQRSQLFWKDWIWQKRSKKIVGKRKPEIGILDKKVLILSRGLQKGMTISNLFTTANLARKDGLITQRKRRAILQDGE